MKKKMFWRIKDAYDKFNIEYKDLIFFEEDRKANVYLDMLEEKIRFSIRLN